LERFSALMAILLAVPAWVGAAPPPPRLAMACTAADQSCKESLTVGSYSFWYFRSYSLNAANPDITRAVIVVHGLDRNAGDYFTTAVTALHNDTDPSLLVIAPHFKGFVKTAQPVPMPMSRASCTGRAPVRGASIAGTTADKPAIPGPTWCIRSA
jgi:hypothetical protein